MKGIVFVIYREVILADGQQPKTEENGEIRGILWPDRYRYAHCYYWHKRSGRFLCPRLLTVKKNTECVTDSVVCDVSLKQYSKSAWRLRSVRNSCMLV